MRVLWFTASPSLAQNHLGYKEIGSGWIHSLERELSRTQRDFELAIAFTWNGEPCKPFSSGGTSYYPIMNEPITNMFRRFKSRWNHEIIEDQNLNKCLAIIDEFKPDIIQIFGTENEFGLLITKTSIPCIIHLQGIISVLIYKWHSGLTRADVLSVSTQWLFLKGYGLFHDFLIHKKMAKREKEIFLSCKYLIGRTDWDKRIASILSPAANYFHCDEIMREIFYTNQWKPDQAQERFIIVTTMRDNLYKGLETVFECKKILSQFHPEIKITWKVAGLTKEDSISVIIERKFKDTFENQEIDLLGPLHEQELLALLLAADLFVHASHIDNSPNSLCEAMLLGMPAISTNVGGIPSILQDKKEGLLVQDGDPYALAGAIIEIMQNNESAITRGANARIRALVRHDPADIAQHVVSIYESVLAKNTTPES